jgi:hypothetical protein
VEDYHCAFEQLVYHIRLYDSALSATILTAHFITGLKDELRFPVEMQLPDSVAKAAVLVAIQEKLLEKAQKKGLKQGGFRTSFQSKADMKAPFASGDMWKVRQLRKHRKANSLCFRYGEKFIPEHKCTEGVPTASVAQIAMVPLAADGGELLLEEILNALECQAAQTDETCFLSLNAISGTQNNRVIHLRALVQNQVLSVLLDSGSSHTFINKTFLSRVPCSTSPAKSMLVKVANRQTMTSSMEVKNLDWWIQGVTFVVDARVLELAAYDLILGIDWLEQHNPMTCN